MLKRSHLAPLACVLVLAALNVYITLKLFGCEYMRSSQSIEGNFIGLTRLLMDKPGQLDWFPFWNAGMSRQHTYFPLLPNASAALGKLAGWPAARSFHWMSALLYCLGPVSLFLLAWVMSRRTGYSFAAGATYSLISPAVFLAPRIRDDIGGLWFARRLHAVVFWGESPHVSALTFVPLALLFLYLSLRHRRPIYYVLTGLLMAATALTNSFGVVVLALGTLALLCTVREGSLLRNLGLTAAIGAIAYLWISPSLPPSLLRVILANSPTAGGDFHFNSRMLLAMAVEASAAAVVWFLGRRLRLADHLRFFLLFAVVVSGIPLLALYANLIVIAQPERYHLDMEMALCLLAPFALQPLLDRMPRKARLALVAVLLGLAVHQAAVYRRFARRQIQYVQASELFEYRTARWFEQHLPGRRVMATGSCSLWLNAFSDSPQLSGGHIPFAPNRQQLTAVYINQSNDGGDRNPEISVLWLKAFGAHAVNVSGPHGGEYYKAIADWKKYEGLLPVLWREGDDTIYAVPQRTGSLARVIPVSAAIRRPPRHGLDVDSIRTYVAALEDASMPLAEIRWSGYTRGHIETSLGQGQVVSLQMNYHPGWHASVNGTGRPLVRDGLGFMLLEPECSGPCTIDLSFDGGWEYKILRVVSWLALIGAAAYLARAPRKRSE